MFRVTIEPNPADYAGNSSPHFLAAVTTLWQVSAIWRLVECLDWEKFLKSYPTAATELAATFTPLGELCVALCGDAGSQLSEFEDEINKGEPRELAARIAAVVSQTRAGCGAGATMSDDEAMMRIKDIMREAGEGGDAR